MAERMADVCIVGGGLVGMFSALFLRQRRKSVILVEKTTCGREASAVNFGNMRLQGRKPAEYALALSAHDLWERFETITGERITIERCGLAYIALGADQHSRLETIHREASAAGVNVDLLDADEVHRLWPTLSDVVTGASWSPRDAVSEPQEACAALFRAIERAGVEIVERTAVQAVVPVQGGLSVRAHDGRAVTCSHVVSAAGAWSGRLAAALGEPVPMFAAGPQLVLTAPAAPLRLPSMLAADGSIIFRQRGDGRILTTMFPRQPSDLDTGASTVGKLQIDRTLRRLAEVVPSLDNLTVERAWSGVEGYLPDMLPVLSPSSTTPGVIHAFGLSGHGYQLSPGVGRVVADLVTQGSAAVPIEAFDIVRHKGEVMPDERLSREFVARQVAAFARPGKGTTR